MSDDVEILNRGRSVFDRLRNKSREDESYEVIKSTPFVLEFELAGKTYRYECSEALEE